MGTAPAQESTAPQDFSKALENGKLANEGFLRCHRFVDGWLKHADPRQA